jgi:hypothetical protein
LDKCQLFGVGIDRPETRAGMWHVRLYGLGSCCDGRHVGLEDLNENGFSAALAPGVGLFCFSLRFPFATVVVSELFVHSFYGGPGSGGSRVTCSSS